MDRPSTPSRLVVIVVVLTFLAALHPLAPPPPYAHFRYFVTHQGPIPDTLSFVAYDADTGEFLYGVSRRACPGAEEDPVATSVQGAGSLPRYYAFRNNWDVGPHAGPETLGQLRTESLEMFADECAPPAGTNHGQSAIAVFSEAGHFAQISSAIYLSMMGDTVHIPDASLGPSHFTEHRVVVVGDPVEVRVWSGVGEKNWSCRMVDPAGEYMNGWFYRNDPGDESRTILQCVSFRYLGGEGGAAGASPRIA